MIRKQALIITCRASEAIRETLEGLKDDAGNTLVSGIFAAVPLHRLDRRAVHRNQRRGCESFPPETAIRKNQFLNARRQAPRLHTNRQKVLDARYTESSWRLGGSCSFLTLVLAVNLFSHST